MAMLAPGRETVGRKTLTLDSLTLIKVAPPQRFRLLRSTSKPGSRS